MLKGEATPAQISYIRSLIEQKDLDKFVEEDQKSWIANPNNHANLTKEQASRVITALKGLPRKLSDPQPIQSEPVVTFVDGKPQVTTSDKVEDKVLAGYYFIVDPTDGVEKFFRVDKPTEGKWKGYTFLKVQASDEFWPIRDRQHKATILDEIAKDPTTAMNEYGLRLGRCGMCNRTLTARDSRLRGIGPVCAAKL